MLRSEEAFRDAGMLENFQKRSLESRQARRHSKIGRWGQWEIYDRTMHVCDRGQCLERVVLVPNPSIYVPLTLPVRQFLISLSTVASSDSAGFSLSADTFLPWERATLSAHPGCFPSMYVWYVIGGRIAH